MSTIRALVWDAIRQADHILLALCIITNLFGVVLIYSATRFYAPYHSMPYKQLIAMGLGIILYFAITQLNIELLMEKWQWVVLGTILLILMLLTPFGREIGGNRAWIRFQIAGHALIPFDIQPAEIVKLFFTMLLSALAVRFRRQNKLNHPLSIAQMAGVLGFYFALLFAISKDAGSCLIYVFIFLFVLWAAGVHITWFALGAAAASAGAMFIWQLLPEGNRWRKRITVCFDHSFDPQGVGFQQTRSYLAIRSGGLTGQGYLQGQMVQSPYRSTLPERHTDFIFSSCAEEWGLVGCAILVFLLLAIVFRCLYIGINAGDEFGGLVAIGYAGMLLAQIGLNIGMCLYVMPVIGITLPFVSYGGSSILTLYATMGVLSGIKMRSLPSWLRDRGDKERGEDTSYHGKRRRRFG